MSVLVVFTCPGTGRDIPVAVVRGDAMLKDMPRSKLEVACLECGRTHRWRVEEGRVALIEQPQPRPARIP